MPAPLSYMPMPVHLSAVMLVAGGLFAALGVALWIISRREPAPTQTLAGVGRVSPITFLVAALACLGVAYHLIVYALEADQFRAPWPIALGVASSAVLLSLGVDAVENRRNDSD